ncbi:adenosylcobinamide-GDP ribazoletransferase [Flavobacterium chuncheonense]|uniref:Adenosylcobinamide-GDP ribazoletransferase n=1 Tax=Flavobacterium chuncheonense TaxID=2026653 RepID=A0ABW5YIC2_9FLAO
MKKEVAIFFTALMFYSRIPCPKNITHDPDYLNKATRYFPLIGWIVGLISGTTYFLMAPLLGTEIAVVLSMVAGILTTGAFHEDGFADVCDGFGGGWTKEKILKIMKDSAIGAYGAIGILLLLLLKFAALVQLLDNYASFFDVIVVFITAYAISRWIASTIIFTSEYVREDELSKSKPIAKAYTWREVVGTGFFGLLPFVYFVAQDVKFSIAILPVFLIRLYMERYFKKWIGGYTGDCLGATQQVCEVVFYLSIIGIWKFI